MLTLEYTNAFKKDVKKLVKRNHDFTKLLDAVVMLAKNERPFAEKFKDHELKGEFSAFRELHIAPDWLLVYRIEDMTCFLVRTGTHSDLFDE